MIILLIILILVLGGGGYHYGGPALGVPLGAILLVLLLWLLVRGRGDL